MMKAAGVFFYNPVISASKKKTVLSEISCNFSPGVRNFLFLLLDKKRITLLPKILEIFSDLIDRQKNIIFIKIYTARPLSEAAVASIAEAYRQKIGASDFKTEVTVDSSLLGGICVQIGDTRYDGTLKSRMKRLASALS